MRLYDSVPLIFFFNSSNDTFDSLIDISSPSKRSHLLYSYRISDCTDDVVSLLTGSDVFEIQALSATLLAKLFGSDPRLLHIDEGKRILHVISAALARLPTVSNY